MAGFIEIPWLQGIQ